MKSRGAAKKTSKASAKGKSPIVKSTSTRTRRNLAKPAKPNKEEAATEAVMAAAVAEVAVELHAVHEEEAAPMPWIAATPSVAIEAVQDPVRVPSPPAPVMPLSPQRPWPMYVVAFASLSTLWMTGMIYRNVARPTFTASAATVPVDSARPYVQIEGTTMVNFVPGQRPVVSFRIKNSGQTPMFITQREVGMTDGAWSSIKLHGPATNTGYMDIGVGATAEISGLMDKTLTRPMLEEIIAGKRPLRAYMRVEYQDASGVKHHAVFSREYDAAKSRTLRAPSFMFPPGPSLMESD